MSVQNTRDMRSADTLTLTANTTLTESQLMAYRTIDVASYALTLPAAAAGFNGVQLDIIDSAGSGTVVVAAGFGGAGSGSDTITMAQGQLAVVTCRKAAWYYLHYVVAA